MIKKSVISVDEITEKIANFCVYRDRCHYEVEQKLNEFNLIEEAKNIIILHLIEHNFLNEERYAKSYARGKFNQNGWGRMKIKYALKNKKIGDRLIQIGLKEIDDEAYFTYLEKKIIELNEKLGGENKFKKIQKIKTHFYQKGFESDLVNGILSELIKV